MTMDSNRKERARIEAGPLEPARAADCMTLAMRTFGASAPLKALQTKFGGRQRCRSA